MTQRIEGKIVSFNWEKGFGFIRNGNDSYFFHKSFFQNDIKRDEIKIGSFFTFEPTPGRKGMEARNLQKSIKHKSYKISEKFIYCKSANPKYGEVLVRTPVKSKMFDSPDEAKEYLHDASLKSQCNSLLNLTYFKDTFSSGNYKYSVHGFEADLALVATPFFVSNNEKLKDISKKIELLTKTAEVESAKQQEIIAEERREQYDKNCFIATAVYGDVDCFQVYEFRKYRDEKLKKTKLGNQFIKFYYLISPTLAKYISQNRLLLLLSRKILDNILKYIKIA
jgi:cold shock CspA family protein